jgi:hypothetical protein
MRNEEGAKVRCPRANFEAAALVADRGDRAEQRREDGRRVAAVENRAAREARVIERERGRKDTILKELKLA